MCAGTWRGASVEKCRFHNPEFLSLYHDGALEESEQREFSRHLLTCRECMEALLQLDRDLFLMETASMEKVPKESLDSQESLESDRSLKTAGSRVLFRLVGEGIELIRNLEGEGAFYPRRFAHAGGEELSFEVKRGALELEIRNEGQESFSLEIKGLAGERVDLYCEGRLIESRSSIRRKSTAFLGLERGNYSVSIGGLEVIRFEVV